jgi:hypothetical protein
MTRTSSRLPLQRVLSTLLLLSFVASSLALFPPRAHATSITFRSSATSTAEIITAPSDIVAGDILVLIDHSNGLSTPTTVIPSGFSALSNVSNPNNRQILSYKLANGTEAGASLTGMSSPTTVQKLLVVFSAGAAALTPSSFNGEMTDGNPVAQTVSGSGGTPPLVILGAYYAQEAAADPRTFTVGGSPAKDGEVSGTDGFGSELWLAYKIYDSNPADASIDMDDEANGNALQSGYIEATIPSIPPDTPTNLITTSVTGAVNLSWTAPTSSGSSNLETYGIWRATSPFTATTTATLIASFATSSGTSYSDSSAVHGTVYYYRVTATNSSATSSLSNQKSSGSNSGRIIRLKGGVRILGGVRLR